MADNNTKRSIVSVVALISGIILGALVMNGLILRKHWDAWTIGDELLSSTLVIYLIGVGFRRLRKATVEARSISPQIYWGRVLGGAWLTYIEIRTWFHPAPNQFSPSNSAEAVGYYTTAILLVAVGLWLLVSGLIPRKSESGAKLRLIICPSLLAVLLLIGYLHREKISVRTQGNAAKDAEEPKEKVLLHPSEVGVILKKVSPQYPPVARAAHIEGKVILHEIIAEDGTVESIEPISGPELLRSSAVNAVKQWVYQPYLLNGEPRKVDTTVIVNFQLTKNGEVSSKPPPTHSSPSPQSPPPSSQ